MASPFAEKLKLEGITLDEEKRCREAFATLPEYVQKTITDAGVVFHGSRDAKYTHPADGKIIFPPGHIEENTTDPAVLPALFFGFGLAQAVKPELSDTMITAAAKFQFDSNIAVMLLQQGLVKPGLVPLQIPPDRRSEYEDKLKQYMAQDKDLLLSEALEGAYAGLKRDRAISSPPHKSLYDTYLTAAKFNAFKEAALQATDTAFTINDQALTEPQRAYFGKLNEIIAILGVTPKAFDDQFRIAAVKQIYADALLAGEKMQGRIPHGHANKEGFSGLRNDLGLDESIKAGPIQLYGKCKNKEKSGLYYAIANSALTELLDQYLGVFHLPEDGMKNTKLLERHKKTQTAIEYLGPDPIHHSLGEKFSPALSPKKDENVLQSYATGQRGLDELAQVVPTMLYEGTIFKNSAAIKDISTSDQEGGYCTFPSGAEYFKKSIQQAIAALAKEKGLDVSSLQNEAKALEVLWPQVIMSPREYEDFQASERGREERRNRKLEEKNGTNQINGANGNSHDADKPKPYPLSHLITQHDNAAWVTEEIVPLAKLLDCRRPAFKKLGDALFALQIAQIIDAHLKNQTGVVKAFLNSGKNPQHAAALQNAKKTVEALFMRAPDQIPAEEKETTEQAKQQLLKSPMLLGLYLGNQKLISDSAAWETADERALYIREELLYDHWPKLAALTLPPRPAPPPKIVAPPPPPIPIKPIEVVTPAVVAAAPVIAVAATPPPPEPVAPPKPIVTPEMLAKQKHQEAFSAARQALLDDAEMFLLQAFDGGYTQFLCELDLKKEGFPITLTFINAEGKKKEFTITQYATEFTRHDVPLTLEDAVDLKISVQSKILNEEGIEPFYGEAKQGRIGVEKDQYLSPNAGNKDKRKVSINASGGVLSWRIDAPYRRHDIVSVSIPLGIPDEPQYKLAPEELSWVEGKGARPERISETAERIKVIMDFIETNGTEKRWVTKRDVQEKLERYVAQNGKEWVFRDDPIPLPGFEEPKILHTVTSPDGRPLQKITLTPVTLQMDPGGDNPSWHMHFDLHANDDPNDNGYGKQLRSRAMNLHTSNKELALARAKESMLGTPLSTGFLPMIQSYAAAHPHDPWTKMPSAKNKEGIAMVGSKKIQNFLDDMLRYEEDIDAHLIKHPTKDGVVTFTLQARRATRPDQGGTAKADPRVICVKDREKNRRPVEITLSIPENLTDRIDGFVKEVSDSIGWYAGNEYSAIALSDSPSQQDERKTPKQYRKTTIPNLLKRAVESHFEKHFGIPCPEIGEKTRQDIPAAFVERTIMPNNETGTGMGA